MKKLKKVLKVLKAIIYIIMFIMFAWFAVSYIEILLKNTSGSPIYSDWNLIINLTEWATNRNN